jgi:GNAT superfamily N-acetyltransferase
LCHDPTNLGSFSCFCSYNNNWLNHLYVLPGHQGQGIGKLLLDNAKNHNSELNLWVFQKNTKAINFYKRNGFKLVLTTDGSANEENEPDAHLIWNKLA